MIIGFIRVMIFGLIAMGILYVIISLYSRSVRQEKLENEAAEKIAAGELAEANRDRYIDDGMRAYESSLRRKMIAGVFAFPVVALVVMVYITNFM